MTIRSVVFAAAISVVLLANVQAQDRAAKGNSLSAAKVKTAKPARAAEVDPVASLKKLIEQGRSKADQQTVVRAVLYSNSDQPKQWRKLRYTISSAYEYDVRKTDSIVSPFVGVAIISLLTEFSELFPSKEDAEAVTQFSNSKSRYDLTLDYAFSEGRWVFRGGNAESRDNSQRIDPTNFRPEREYIDDVTRDPTLNNLLPATD